MNYFEYMFRTLIPKVAPFKVFTVRIISLVNLVVSQLVTQSTSMSVGKSLSQLVGRSVSQLISQSVSKWVYLLVYKSLNMVIDSSDFHILSPRSVEYVTSGNKITYFILSSYRLSRGLTLILVSQSVSQSVSV